MAAEDAAEKLSQAMLQPVAEIGRLLAGEIDKIRDRLQALELEVERLRDRQIDAGEDR